MLCLLSPESRVPQHHPLRRVKILVDEVLRDLSPLFDEMYAELGRPSIPPERLLKAKVLQAIYTIRSESLLVEALDYNLLFRWFLDLNLLRLFDAVYRLDVNEYLGNSTLQLVVEHWSPAA